ncbi:hypothetical protein QPL39_23520 [Escherichia coli]|uniref:hypothetical protein n=1 Tax=Escherichia coli TaxID=562 RepID=UPI00287B3B23|nr:hypothetical protein [Escherichia coli]MDS1727867.1 hypothetical protein [Escherichia coli]
MKRQVIKLNANDFMLNWCICPHLFAVVLKYLDDQATKEGKVIRLVKSNAPEADQAWIDEKFQEF